MCGLVNPQTARMIGPRLPGGLPARSWQADGDVTDFLSTNDTDGSQIVLATDCTDKHRFFIHK